MRQKRKFFKSILLVALIFLFACLFGGLAEAAGEYEIVASTATTTTVRVYAGSGDGWVSQRNASWDIARNSELGIRADYLGTQNYTEAEDTNSNGDTTFHRAFIPFSTIFLDKEITILSAELILYNWNVLNMQNDVYDYITLVQSFQASSTSLALSDYSKCGNTLDNPEEGTDKRVDLSDFVVGDYLTIPLNKTGISWINQDGFTTFGLREGHDIENVEMQNSKTNGLHFYTSEYEDKSKRPYLEITYANEPVSKVIHPVVLVHGLMGSIEKDGKRILDPIFHIYDNLILALVNSGYEIDKNLFNFNYDWRRDNSSTAELLKAKIAEIKNSTGFEQVDIVAHSMGGLVSRAYIEGDNYNNDVDQLIMIATPQTGATKAYLTWSGAYFYGGFSQIKKFKFIHEAATHNYSSLVDYIREGAPSSGQLLPTFEYLYDFTGEDWTLRSYGDDYPRNNFLEELNSDTALARLNDRVEVLSIVSEADNSAKNSTLNALHVSPDPDASDGKWEHGYPEDFTNKASAAYIMGDGDKTVPRQSLDYLQLGEQYEMFNVNHNELVTTAQYEVIENLRGEWPTEYYEGPIGAVERVLFIRAYSPIDFQVIDPNGQAVGKNITNTIERNNILGAYYSGFNDDAEFITIPNPVTGKYKIIVKGVANGHFGLGVNILDSGRYKGDNIYWGEILEGASQEFSFSYELGDNKPNIDKQEVEVELVGFEKLIKDTRYLSVVGAISHKRLQRLLLKKFKRLSELYEKYNKVDYRWRRFLYKKHVKIGLYWSKKYLKFSFRQKKLNDEAYNVLIVDIDNILKNF